MAVGVQLEFRGSTLEQYDLAAESLGLLPGGPAARHQLFHWVTKTDDGIRCTDVWETQEAFEAFWARGFVPSWQRSVWSILPRSSTSRSTTTSPGVGGRADRKL